jgi:hypothetical protein
MINCSGLPSESDRSINAPRVEQRFGLINGIQLLNRLLLPQTDSFRNGLKMTTPKALPNGLPDILIIQNTDRNY